MAVIESSVNKKSFFCVQQEGRMNERFIMSNGFGNVRSPDNDDVHEMPSHFNKDYLQFSYPRYVPPQTESVQHRSNSAAIGMDRNNREEVCFSDVAEKESACNAGVWSPASERAAVNYDGDRKLKSSISSDSDHRPFGIASKGKEVLKTVRIERFSGSCVGSDTGTSAGIVTHREASYSDVIYSDENPFPSHDGDCSEYDGDDVEEEEELHFEELDVKPTIVDEDICLSLNEESGNGRSFRCKLCGKSFAVIESFEKSMELHAKLHHDKLFCCPFCNKNYRWRRSLEKHVVKVHPGAFPFKCGTCGKKYQNEYSLSNHEKKHFVKSHSHGSCEDSNNVVASLAKPSQIGQNNLLSTNDPTKVQCQLCPKSYMNKGSLMKHIKLAHTEGVLCKCETCGKECNNAYSLKVHMGRHNAPLPVCDICKRTFTSRKSLRQHVELHERGKPICSDCGREFSCYENLKRHMLLHSDEVRNLCDICGKTFARVDRFNRHLRKHLDEKPFECPTCQKAFRDKFSLNLHLRKHTGEKPFLCNVCGKSFSNKGTLRMHISRHTGDSQYKCTICNKIFAYSTYRTAHMRIHTSEKPYKCSVCSKEFTQKSSLNFHMGSHSGEKKHKCSICDKAFLHMTYLTVHMRIHTGEKPYKCSSCHKGFSQRSSLNTHMRSCT